MSPWNQPEFMEVWVFLVPSPFVPNGSGKGATAAVPATWALPRMKNQCTRTVCTMAMRPTEPTPIPFANCLYSSRLKDSYIRPESYLQRQEVHSHVVPVYVVTFRNQGIRLPHPAAIKGGLAYFCRSQNKLAFQKVCWSSSLAWIMHWRRKKANCDALYQWEGHMP